MSFILDALRKAESERNRRVAPVLMDARIAPPRRGLPGWALALGAVLLVNLGVIAWLLLRTSPGAPGTTAGTAATPPAPATVVTVPPATPAPVTAAPVTTAPPAMTPPAAITASPFIAPPPDAATATAVPPPAVQPPAGTGNLPTLQELRYAGIALPELNLDLHIYDPAPAHRSVLLNGQRLREGEYAPNGVKVERITPTGAVLEAGGRRFELNVGG